MDKICVIGLGYVGLPLAHAFCEKHKTIGFDIASWRTEELNNGYDRTLKLNKALNNGIKLLIKKGHTVNKSKELDFNNSEQVVYNIKSVLKNLDKSLL